MGKRIAAVLLLFLMISGSLLTGAGQTKEQILKDSYKKNTEQIIEFIQDFLSRRTNALVDSGRVETYFKIDKSTVKESESIFHKEICGIEELIQKKETLLHNGVKYTLSELSVAIEKEDFIDSHVIMEIKEQGKLYYKKEQGNEPDFTAWQTDRVFEFSYISDQWVLDSQRLKYMDGIAPINEPREVTKEEMTSSEICVKKRATEEDSIVRQKNEKSINNRGYFSRQECADYATTWWSSHNSEYVFYEGKDCTNFISQALRAGGWTFETDYFNNDKNWYYYNVISKSDSWSSVEHWYLFAAIHSGRTAILLNPLSLYVGEILQMGFNGGNTKNHSMVVTGKGVNDIYLTYHSNDTLNRSYQDLAVSYPNASWYPHLVYSMF